MRPTAVRREGLVFGLLLGWSLLVLAIALVAPVAHAQTGPTLTVAPVTVHLGDSATLTAVVTGAGTSYTLSWYSGAVTPPCSGTPLQTGTSDTFTTGPLSANTSYCVMLDAGTLGTAMTTVTVTVVTGTAPSGGTSGTTANDDYFYALLVGGGIIGALVAYWYFFSGEDDEEGARRKGATGSGDSATTERAIPSGVAPRLPAEASGAPSVPKHDASQGVGAKGGGVAGGEIQPTGVFDPCADTKKAYQDAGADYDRLDGELDSLLANTPPSPERDETARQLSKGKMQAMQRRVDAGAKHVECQENLYLGGSEFFRGEALRSEDEVATARFQKASDRLADYREIAGVESNPFALYVADPGQKKVKGQGAPIDLKGLSDLATEYQSAQRDYLKKHEAYQKFLDSLR